MVLKKNFQKYFSYIETVCFIGEETGVPRENHWPDASNCCI